MASTSLLAVGCPERSSTGHASRPTDAERNAERYGLAPPRVTVDALHHKRALYMHTLDFAQCSAPFAAYAGAAVWDLRARLSVRVKLSPIRRPLYFLMQLRGFLCTMVLSTDLVFACVHGDRAPGFFGS